MMKGISALALLSATFLLSSGAKAQTGKQTWAAGDVTQILKNYDEAWNKRDTGAVGKILAPNYIYFTSTGGISTRQQTLDLLNSPKYKLTFAERSEIKTYQTGNVVIVNSRWKGKGTYGEEEINDDQRCGLIFIKQKSVWRLLSEHCTQIVRK
jgi:ketosteroid isomerase-like protein